MPEADRTTPQTIKKKIRRKKPAPKPAYKLPSNFKTQAAADRPRQQTAGPVKPQQTGRAKPQPIARKRNAPPTSTDTTSSARRTPAQKAHDKAVSDANIREARRAVIRKRGRGAIVQQAKKELEGRGALAKGLSKLADVTEKTARLQSTGGGPGAVQLGVKAGGGKLSPTAATALAPKPIKIKGTFLGKTLKDAVNFPAQALPSVYVPAAGAVEAAKGRPQRIKKFAEDFKQTDPIYNTVAAGVEAARGNSKAAKSHLRKAEKSASEHPGFTAIEVAGVKGAVGRGAGAAMRSGVAGKAAKRAASTERPARVVPGTNIREERAHSRDVITKGTVVAVEKARRKSAQRLRAKAEKAPPDQAEALRERAARRSPDRLSEHEIKRQVDERVAVNEDIRRQHRADVVHEARQMVRKAKRGGHATSVVAQRIARADREDLRAYVEELKGQFDGLSPSGKRANKTLRRKLQTVIDDPKADMGAIESAAKDYEKLIRPLEKKLVKRGLLGAKQEETAKLIPYAVRHMGARHDPEHGVVSKTGVPLSAGAIRAHMKRSGEGEAAFITQAPNARGARNFNVRSERPVAIPSIRRTGEATRKGTFDANPETLVEGAARTQGLVDATDGFRRVIKDMGARHPDTKKLRRFKSYREAQQAAKDLVHDHEGNPVPGAVALRPVRLNPFGAKKEQLDNLLEHVDSLDQPQAQALVDAMREGLSGTKGKGPWALIPEAAAKRLEDHLNTQGGGGGLKTFQLANQAFRKTVLSTSTSWMAGNVIEGLGRAALAKAGPASYVRGRGALRELQRIDPKAAEEAAHRIVGGGHFASASSLHMRRGAEQFEGTRMAPLASALGKFWRTPGPKQAAHFWNAWTEFVFQTVNGRLESRIQTAMLGRALKTSGLKAIDDAAKGLKETPAQVRFGREVDRMYGRYSKLAPNERRLISTYTPFIAWAGNATYFIARTLPRDHPVATAVIASAEQATDEWRKSQGLDWFVQGALPGFLQGSIPTGKGGHQRISRYTPFGAFSDPTDTAASQVLPLMSGVLAAFKGKDWKGQDLKVKGDDGKLRPANPLERTVAAVGSFVDATVPVYSQAKRAAEMGPRAFDPFRNVKPKPAVKKKIRTVHHRTRSTSSSSSSSGSFFGGESSSSGSSSGGSFFGN